jgi:hypothetical protein
MYCFFCNSKNSLAYFPLSIRNLLSEALNPPSFPISANSAYASGLVSLNTAFISSLTGVFLIASIVAVLFNSI